MKYLIFEFDDSYTREDLERMIEQIGFNRTQLYNLCKDIKFKEDLK